MTRGTTPTHSFTIPFVDPNINLVSIAYAQGGSIVLEKTADDCTIAVGGTTTTITTKLSENDTLLFKSGMVEIQLRLGDSNGERFASKIIRTPCDSILKDGVLE